MRVVESFELEVGGVPVTVQRKPVRGLRVRVTPPAGDVVLSLPLHATRDQAAAFVAQHLDWVHRHTGRVRARAGRPTELVDGGRAPLWGQWRGLRVSTGERATARLVGDTIHLAGSDDAALQRALDSLYRNELGPVAGDLVARWATAVRRSPSRLRYRRMTTRWGTCNTQTGAITLNIALAERPVEQLEYVVVHELVHLLERGHGPAFKGHLDRLLPAWRAAAQALKLPPCAP